MKLKLGYVPVADRNYSVQHRATFLRFGIPALVTMAEATSTARILQVPCPHPTCVAGALEWCRYADGNHYAFLHMARYHHSVAKGYWGVAEIEIPEEEV